jgi:hypothetical protein
MRLLAVETRRGRGARGLLTSGEQQIPPVSLRSRVGMTTFDGKERWGRLAVARLSWGALDSRGRLSPHGLWWLPAKADSSGLATLGRRNDKGLGCADSGRELRHGPRSWPFPNVWSPRRGRALRKSKSPSCRLSA